MLMHKRKENCDIKHLIAQRIMAWVASRGFLKLTLSDFTELPTAVFGLKFNVEFEDAVYWIFESFLDCD